MQASDYIRDLTANGMYHFTTADAIKVLDRSPDAVRAQLLRLKQQGFIAEPVRSFHVVIPPEYSRLGCLPAEQFIDQLMRFWDEPYYIGLLSAAERHGAAHQRPQATQVVIRRNRQPVVCGHVRVVFIARGDMMEMPVSTLNTPRGVVRYSSPELTALELVGYPRHGGGLNNVITVLAELAEELAPQRLIEVARVCPISWSQRLGYLLELVDQAPVARSLEDLVSQHARSYTPLRRSGRSLCGKRVKRWKLIINVEVEPDE